jgi:Fe2+ or Zn2+ uptake regulation protein
MSEIADADVRTIAAEIVSYLRAHPEAADTVDGAARWWLARPAHAATVDRAMTLLVECGKVEKHTLPDGTTVFRSGPQLNHD